MFSWYKSLLSALLPAYFITILWPTTTGFNSKAVKLISYPQEHMPEFLHNATNCTKFMKQFDTVQYAQMNFFLLPSMSHYLKKKKKKNCITHLCDSNCSKPTTACQSANCQGKWKKQSNVQSNSNSSTVTYMYIQQCTQIGKQNKKQ